MKKICVLSIFNLIVVLGFSQTQLKIYHGANGETQVLNESNIEVRNSELILTPGKNFTVKVINANPLFYNYTLKVENLTFESEDKNITDLLNTFNTILSSSNSAALTNSNQTAYYSAIDTLTSDINKAKQFILASDRPEPLSDAIVYGRTGGLRMALDNINSLPSTHFHFHSPSLLVDLNALSDNMPVTQIEKDAFHLLNASIVQNLNEIKSKTDQSTLSVWQKDFIITDTAVKITLVISKIDKSNTSLLRDGFASDYSVDVVNILPSFKHTSIELIPVANIILPQEARVFYLEDNVVHQKWDSKATISAGMVLNFNIMNFGDRDETALGIGPGFKFNTKGDEFENLYLSFLLSYKNFIRFGIGAGFGQFPTDELKDGGKVNEPLPANISDLNDLINYDEKPCVFFTIAFKGLNVLTKK